MMNKHERVFLFGLVLLLIGNGLVALGIVMRARGH